MSVVYLPSAYTKPIAMPATGALIGTPASISDSVEPHTDAIDVEPFEAMHVGDDAQRVRPLERGRDHGNERPLGERTVADLAALRRPHPAGLTRGERREVVVVHVALLVVERDRVEHLLHARHAERGDRQDLRLAPLEEAGAVRGRDDADFGAQRTEVGGTAAVDADTFVDDAACG